VPSSTSVADAAAFMLASRTAELTVTDRGHPVATVRLTDAIAALAGDGDLAAVMSALRCAPVPG
jgi:hypothetical protein